MDDTVTPGTSLSKVTADPDRTSVSKQGDTKSNRSLEYDFRNPRSSEILKGERFRKFVGAKIQLTLQTCFLVGVLIATIFFVSVSAAILQLSRKRTADNICTGTRKSNSLQQTNFETCGSIDSRYSQIIMHNLISTVAMATVIHNFESNLLTISDSVATSGTPGASTGSDEDELLRRKQNSEQDKTADGSRAGYGSSAGSQVFTVDTQTKPSQEMLENIQYESLKVATGGFDERKRSDGGRLIAAGSFGHVFWAVWEGREVAVKRLKQPRSHRPSSVHLSKRQYMNELSVAISCPEHPNIVRLIGISDDGPELLLVYEYVEGHTLAYHLVKGSADTLFWSDRLLISIGIARSINHIQLSCSRPIIHRDVKSSNVLLTRDFTARLSDFGLSCFAEFSGNIHASFFETGSTTVGTRCYMPPEAFKGIFSTRTDVYSFGAILLELVTGLPPYSWSKKIDLVTFLRDLEKDGTDLVAISDPLAAWPSDVADKLIHLAKQCTDMDPHNRPLMSKVLRKLEVLEQRQRNRLS